MKLEKRKDNRVILSVTVQYKVFQLDRLEKDVQDETLGLKAALQNVSLGGLQVVSAAPFQKGDILEIQLEIPNGGRVRSVAKVAWCEKDGAGPDYRSGIQFIPVYEDDLKKLVDFLKGNK